MTVANSIAETAAVNPLSQATTVGQGFNVYGELDVSSLTVPLVDPAKAGTTTFHFQGNDYSIPGYVVPIENPQTYLVRSASSSREEAQDELAVHAGVGGSYGAFSGELRTDFGFTTSSTSEDFLCFWRFYIPLAILELDPAKAKKALSDDFLAAVDALPVPLSVNDNKTAYFDFFSAFGPYYTRAVTIGGELSLFNQVHKSSNLTSAQLEVALQAEYDGLFTTGTLDVSVLGQSNWNSYASSSNVTIKASGGDQALATRLAGADPFAFSAGSVDLYAKWATSLGVLPAVVDFQLGGVWDLVSDQNRARALQEAWQLYAQEMHPRVWVQTTSSTVSWPNSVAPTPPILIVGKALKPATAPTSPVGLQAVVLSGDDVTSPDAVLFNRFYSMPKQQDWGSVYQTMWDSLTDDVLGSYDEPGNILVLATFGLDRDMPPTDEALSLLETAGAGDVLNTWVSTSDPGSKSGVNNWVGQPHDYAIVGVFGRGPGTAVEAVVDADRIARLSLQVFLYRERYDGQYQLAAA